LRAAKADGRFALKPGRVTILRLGDDGQNLRMAGDDRTGARNRDGCARHIARVAFDADVGAFLDEMLSHGWEHHLIMAYGEIVPELEMLCAR